MASPCTVLLVDDDAAVRESTGLLLRSLVFCVLAAQSGHEAMRRLAQIQVDVLLADIVMPDLDGIELAKRARLFQPEIKVVFMTGYRCDVRRSTRCSPSTPCRSGRTPSPACASSVASSSPAAGSRWASRNIPVSPGPGCQRHSRRAGSSSERRHSARSRRSRDRQNPLRPRLSTMNHKLSNIAPPMSLFGPPARVADCRAKI
jgi:two-component system cell cycle response regulator CpdR